jgi:hypothetical protein
MVLFIEKKYQLNQLSNTNTECSKWKANISKSHIGKTHNEKTKLKLAKFNSKLTDTEVIEIDKMIKSKISYKIISEKYNISPSQITQIKQRKTYYWINLD